MLFSCVNNDLPEKDGVIKLNLTIEPFDAGTKAAKTAWTDGDRINIWFDNSSFNVAAPDLVITYNGGAWTAGALKDGANPLSSGGKLSYFYEGYNDLSSYGFDYSTSAARASYTKGGRLTPGSDSKYSYNTPLVVISGNDVSYTFSSNTLTATLSGWIFPCQFKVLVKGLIPSPSDVDKYQLNVLNNSTDQYANSVKSITLEQGMGMGYTLSYNDGWAGGVLETDGVAFYYYSFSFASNNEINITLYDGSIKKYYDVEGGKTVSTSINKCVGVSINYSDFK